MAALGIGHPVLRGGEPERQLRAEDGADPELGGGLGEPDHPVHAVVVGECERVQAQARRLLDQLLGVARTVQEAEVGVAVQLGVRDARARWARDGSAARYGSRLRDQAGESPPSASGAARQTRARAAGERGLQLGPRHVRVAPPHARDSTRTNVRIRSIERELSTGRTMLGAVDKTLPPGPLTRSPRGARSRLAPCPHLPAPRAGEDRGHHRIRPGCGRWRSPSPA